MTHTASKTPKLWAVIAAAAFILLITIGMRMTLGLFVQPVVNTTELSIAQFSLIITVFQLMWGVLQPLSGALADRFGAFRVLSGGALLLVCACLIASNIPTYWGADDCRRAAARIRHRFRRVFHHYGTGRRPSPHTQTRLGIRTGQRRRFGRTIPVRTAGSRTQGLVVLPEVGWTGTFYVWGAIALLILPVSWWLAGGNNAAHTQHTQATHGQSLGEAVKTAFKTPSYILLHLSFFAYGFHIAFLVTHLPTEVALCGLPATVASTSIAIIGLANIAGCVFSG